MTPELRERFWADFKYDHNIKTGQKGKQLCDAHSDKGEKRAKYKNIQEIKSEPNENESPKMLKLIIAQARPPTKKYIYVHI